MRNFALNIAPRFNCIREAECVKPAVVSLSFLTLMAHSRGHSGGAAQFHSPEHGLPIRARRGGGLCEGDAPLASTCRGFPAHRLPYLQGHWHPVIPSQQRQDEVLP